MVVFDHTFLTFWQRAHTLHTQVLEPGFSKMNIILLFTGVTHWNHVFWIFIQGIFEYGYEPIKYNPPNLRKKSLYLQRVQNGEGGFATYELTASYPWFCRLILVCVIFFMITNITDASQLNVNINRDAILQLLFRFVFTHTYG